LIRLLQISGNGRDITNHFQGIINHVMNNPKTSNRICKLMGYNLLSACYSLSSNDNLQDWAVLIDVVGRDLSGDDPDLRISALKAIPQLNPTVIKDAIVIGKLSAIEDCVTHPNALVRKTAVHCIHTLLIRNKIIPRVKDFCRLGWDLISDRLLEDTDPGVTLASFHAISNLFAECKSLHEDTNNYSRDLICTVTEVYNEVVSKLLKAQSFEVLVERFIALKVHSLQSIAPGIGLFVNSRWQCVDTLTHLAILLFKNKHCIESFQSKNNFNISNPLSPSNAQAYNVNYNASISVGSDNNTPESAAASIGPFAAVNILPIANPNFSIVDLVERALLPCLRSSDDSLVYSAGTNILLLHEVLMYKRPHWVYSVIESFLVLLQKETVSSNSARIVQEIVNVLELLEWRYFSKVITRLLGTIQEITDRNLRIGFLRDICDLIVKHHIKIHAAAINSASNGPSRTQLRDSNYVNPSKSDDPAQSFIHHMFLNNYIQNLWKTTNRNRFGDEVLLMLSWSYLANALKFKCDPDGKINATEESVLLSAPTTPTRGRGLLKSSSSLLNVSTGNFGTLQRTSSYYRDFKDIHNISKDYNREVVEVSTLLSCLELCSVSMVTYGALSWDRDSQSRYQSQRTLVQLLDYVLSVIHQPAPSPSKWDLIKNSDGPSKIIGHILSKVAEIPSDEVLVRTLFIASKHSNISSFSKQVITELSTILESRVLRLDAFQQFQTIRFNNHRNGSIIMPASDSHLRILSTSVSQSVHHIYANSGSAVTFDNDMLQNTYMMEQSNIETSITYQYAIASLSCLATRLSNYAKQDATFAGSFADVLRLLDAVAKHKLAFFKDSVAYARCNTVKSRINYEHELLHKGSLSNSSGGASDVSAAIQHDALLLEMFSYNINESLFQDPSYDRLMSDFQKNTKSVSLSEASPSSQAEDTMQFYRLSGNSYSSPFIVQAAHFMSREKFQATLYLKITNVTQMPMTNIRVIVTLQGNLRWLDKSSQVVKEFRCINSGETVEQDLDILVTAFGRNSVNVDVAYPYITTMMQNVPQPSPVSKKALPVPAAQVQVNELEWLTMRCEPYIMQLNDLLLPANNPDEGQTDSDLRKAVTPCTLQDFLDLWNRYSASFRISFPVRLASSGAANQPPAYKIAQSIQHVMETRSPFSRIQSREYSQSCFHMQFMALTWFDERLLLQWLGVSDTNANDCNCVVEFRSSSSSVLLALQTNFQSWLWSLFGHAGDHPNTDGIIIDYVNLKPSFDLQLAMSHPPQQASQPAPEPTLFSRWMEKKRERESHHLPMVRSLGVTAQ